MRHPFRVARLWKMDPAPVLETGEWRMLPWSVLMKSSDVEVRKVASVLGREGDEESIARFLTLGGFRYDRGQLEGMLGVKKMPLVEEILLHSSIFKEAREEAVKEAVEHAVEEARAEDQVENRRHSIRVVLRLRFPGLEEAPELDRIADPDRLSALFEIAVTATDREAVVKAIAAAVSSN
jgi:hypothetical protein